MTFRPIALTASSRFSFLLPVMNTNAPSSTNSFADASAIPEVAPVITATLPSNLPMTTLLLLALQLNTGSLVGRAVSRLPRSPAQARLLAWLRHGVNQLRCRSARAMLIDNLHEENETALVNEEGGWVGRLARCVPAKPVLVGKRVAGIKHKVEVRRQLLAHQKFRGTCVQVLGRARIDKDHVGS